jgi:hypothetical protein
VRELAPASRKGLHLLPFAVEDYVSLGFGLALDPPAIGLANPEIRELSLRTLFVRLILFSFFLSFSFLLRVSGKGKDDCIFVNTRRK